MLRILDSQPARRNLRKFGSHDKCKISNVVVVASHID